MENFKFHGAKILSKTPAKTITIYPTKFSFDLPVVIILLGMDHIYKKEPNLAIFFSSPSESFRVMWVCSFAELSHIRLRFSVAYRH